MLHTELSTFSHHPGMYINNCAWLIYHNVTGRLSWNLQFNSPASKTCFPFHWPHSISSASHWEKKKILSPTVDVMWVNIATSGGRVDWKASIFYYSARSAFWFYPPSSFKSCLSSLWSQGWVFWSWSFCQDTKQCMFQKVNLNYFKRFFSQIQQNNPNEMISSMLR